MRRFSATIVSASASAAAIIVASAGLAHAATNVAVWHLDDTGTTMADASGNGNNGTLKNVTPGQPGIAGTAFGFSGKPSYVSVPSSSTLNPGTSNFQVTLHLKFTVKPSSSVGDYDVLRKGLVSTSGGSFKVEILKSGKALCDYRDTHHEVIVNSGPDLSDGAWHTIGCGRTASAVTLTVDGTSYVKKTATVGISNSSVLMIGAKNTKGDDQFEGLIDEVTLSAG